MEKSLVTALVSGMPENRRVLWGATEDQMNAMEYGSEAQQVMLALRWEMCALEALEQRILNNAWADDLQTMVRKVRKDTIVGDDPPRGL